MHLSTEFWRSPEHSTLRSVSSMKGLKRQKMALQMSAINLLFFTFITTTDSTKLPLEALYCKDRFLNHGIQIAGIGAGAITSSVILTELSRNNVVSLTSKLPARDNSICSRFTFSSAVHHWCEESL